VGSMIALATSVLRADGRREPPPGGAGTPHAPARPTRPPPLP
jgi:hypothetical protein